MIHRKVGVNVWKGDPCIESAPRTCATGHRAMCLARAVNRYVPRRALEDVVPSLPTVYPLSGGNKRPMTKNDRFSSFLVPKVDG